MEPTNHPFGKENDLNQTSMIMFHVSLQGCMDFLSRRNNFVQQVDLSLGVISSSAYKLNSSKTSDSHVRSSPISRPKYSMNIHSYVRRCCPTFKKTMSSLELAYPLPGRGYVSSQEDILHINWLARFLPSSISILCFQLWTKFPLFQSQFRQSLAQTNEDISNVWLFLFCFRVKRVHEINYST